MVLGDPATGQRYYYVYNGHGDVVALTDSSGNVVASYSYDAFGVITSSSENFPNGWSNPYRYDGADLVRYDSETGLYWMSVRAYDPTLGRFISHDPLGRLAAEGIDFHPYVYAENNPLINVDPSGKRVVCGAGDGCGGSGPPNSNDCAADPTLSGCPHPPPTKTPPPTGNGSGTGGCGHGNPKACNGGGSGSDNTGCDSKCKQNDIDKLIVYYQQQEQRGINGDTIAKDLAQLTLTAFTLGADISSENVLGAIVDVVSLLADLGGLFVDIATMLGKTVPTIVLQTIGFLNELAGVLQIGKGVFSLFFGFSSILQKAFKVVKPAVITAFRWAAGMALAGGALSIFSGNQYDIEAEYQESVDALHNDSTQTIHAKCVNAGLTNC